MSTLPKIDDLVATTIERIAKEEEVVPPKKKAKRERKEKDISLNGSITKKARSDKGDKPKEKRVKKEKEPKIKKVKTVKISGPTIANHEKKSRKKKVKVENDLLDVIIPIDVKEEEKVDDIWGSTLESSPDPLSI